MNLTINDAELAGFNAQARSKLAAVSQTFISDLIEEANRIESARNTANSPPEVTSSMVYDADLSFRRGFTPPKKRWGMRIVRILSAVISLAAGALYDATRLQSGAYMLFYILIITAAILLVTVSTLKE